MRRPWRARIWLWKPEWYFPSWSPAYFGGDEYDWHTIMLGWAITGRIIIATRHCPGTGRCAEVHPLTDWPIAHHDMDTP